MMPLACLVNGRPGDTVGVTNRGLQYGDGLFETVAVQNGQPLLWSRHIERLATGAARLGLDPIDPLLFAREVTELVQGAPLAILKLMLVRETSGRGYRSSSQAADRILTLWPWPGSRRHAGGIDVGWCSTRLSRQPRLAGLKHLNRLEQVLAQNELDSRYTEGLMCDTEEWVIEGTMSNVFLCSGGCLVTPSLDQAGVAGVMRARVIECARDLGIEAYVRNIKRDDVLAADEVFLTNSVWGVCPVRSLPECCYEEGPIARQMSDMIRACGDAPAL